jgi:hypothetical protein
LYFHKENQLKKKKTMKQLPQLYHA